MIINISTTFAKKLQIVWNIKVYINLFNVFYEISKWKTEKKMKHSWNLLPLNFLRNRWSHRSFYCHFVFPWNSFCYSSAWLKMFSVSLWPIQALKTWALASNVFSLCTNASERKSNFLSRIVHNTSRTCG